VGAVTGANPRVWSEQLGRRRLGRSKQRWSEAVAVGRAQFHGLNILFQYFFYSKFEKYKSCTSGSPNFFKLCKVVYNFERNNFPFGKMFKFQAEFEKKIRKQSSLEFGLNLKGV
jgi:hypothetical protein